jgi:hypothetical protein
MSRPVKSQAPARQRAAPRARDLAAIHIAKNRLSMPDDSYRMQVRLASGGQQQPDGSVTGGHDTAALLSAEQRGALLPPDLARIAAGYARRIGGAG